MVVGPLLAARLAPCAALTICRLWLDRTAGKTLGFGGLDGRLSWPAALLWLEVRPRNALVAPEPSLFFRDRNGRFLGEITNPETGELGYWKLERLPDRVAAATLAAEDRRFTEHPGVDLRAIARAAWHNLEDGRRRSGASTIAMQVARMQEPGPRTCFRKLREAGTALALTRSYGREAVLAHYLTIAPYGNRIHGIAYAARRYFDKPVEDLSWAEISLPRGHSTISGADEPLLAGRPGVGEKTRPLDPQPPLRRKPFVEDRAPGGNSRASGALHPPARQPSDRVPARPFSGRRASTGDGAGGRVSQPLVTTTLDLDLQSEVAWIMAKALRQWESQGARNAAVIVLDRRTNEVLGWVGSTDYFDGPHAGSIDYASVPRSPGSALKPFFYALALEEGIIRPDTVLDDLERGAGGITNADDRFLGPLLPRTALANSRNVPAANLLDQIGIEEGYEFLRQLGLHEGRQPARRYGLGLSIGGLPVTLEQLVHAYTVLARQGMLDDLVWYRDQPRGATRRLLSPETAWQISTFLSDPMARLPSFARMGSLEYPFPVAVKTGTSSRFRDAWAVAFSNRVLVGAWVGDPDFQPMNRLTGFNSAAELTKAVLSYVHGDQVSGLDAWSLPAPLGYRSSRLCAVTGKLATPACDRVSLEWFREGEEPIEECSAHVVMAIDTRTGRPATSTTPVSLVEVRTVLDLPPRYAEWMASQGLSAAPLEMSASLLFPGPDESPAAASAPPPEVRLRVTSPAPGLRLLQDPETPPELETISLNVVADPPVPQVLWYVDGQPFQLAEYPYSARWPLHRGEHVIHAQVPLTATRSAGIRVVVE